MVDGISFCLGHLRPQEKQEVIDVAQSGIADEVLRAVRGGHGAFAVWQALGGCLGVSEATLLFACLCEQTGELGHVFNGPPSGIGEIREAGLREMRRREAPARPSQGWQPSQQCAGQFRDALRKLSSESPQVAGTISDLGAFNTFPLSRSATSRVGRLRAYGNAIVPPLAADFIGAYLDA
jgi:hypothetical protein